MFCSAAIQIVLKRLHQIKSGIWCAVAESRKPLIFYHSMFIIRTRHFSNNCCIPCLCIPMVLSVTGTNLSTLEGRMTGLASGEEA